MTASPTRTNISPTLSSLNLRTKQLDSGKSVHSSLSNISKPSFSNESASIAEITVDEASVEKGKYLNTKAIQHSSLPQQVTNPILSPLPPQLFLSKPYTWLKIKNFFRSIFFTKTGVFSAVIILTGSLALAGVITIPSLAPIVFLFTAVALVSVGASLLLYKYLTTPFFYGEIDNEFSKNIQLMSKGTSLDQAPQDQVITKSDLRVLSGIILQAHIGKLNCDKWQLIKKNKHNCEHSFLVCGNNSKLDIIIKPKIHNYNFDYQYLKKGAFKTIKRGGIRIILNLDKFNYFAERIVTCSKILKNEKKLDLKEYSREDLIKGRFKKIEFNDRALYLKKDLGPNLEDLITEKSLNGKQKIDIANELIKNIKLGETGDIKLQNITYDGENAHYIDDPELVFTYTTKFQKFGGNYTKFKPSEFENEFGDKLKDVVIKQQILGLTLVLFQLFNNLNYKKCSRIHNILSKKNEKDSQLRNSLMHIERKETFFKELKEAYNGKLALEELKKKIEDLKITDFQATA